MKRNPEGIFKGKRVSRRNTNYVPVLQKRSNKIRILKYPLDSITWEVSFGGMEEEMKDG